MQPAESPDELSRPAATAPLELSLREALCRHLHDLSNRLWPVVVQADCALSGSAPQVELLSRIRDDLQEALNIATKMSDLLRGPMVSDNDAQHCADPLPDPSSKPPARLRVLCVDGHLDAGPALAHMVRHLGHEVDLVRTGSTALAAVAMRAYDVVLTDIRLADMSGRELTRQLRESGPTSVIWLAGADIDSAAAAAPGLVVPNCILTKPLSLDALRKALAGHPGQSTTSS